MSLASSTALRKVARDLWGERSRSARVVVAIALGIAAYQTVMSSYAILDRELDRGYLATNPASATLRTEDVDPELLAAVEALPGVAVAEARRAVGGRIKAGAGEWRNLLLFVVADYSRLRLSTITPETGAWPPAAGELLIERDAFGVARAKVGDVVEVRMPQGDIHRLRVSGGVHDVCQAQARMERTVYGYITLETLALLGLEPKLDQLKILVAEKTFDREHIAAVARDVEDLLVAHGKVVRAVDIPAPGRHPHADLMRMLLLAISSFGLLVLVLSGVLVVNLFHAILARELRQIGVMKAIGGRRRQIAGLYLGEAVLLGFAAVVLALPAGNLGARALCRSLAVFLNFDLESLAVPFWVYGLVALVGLATPLLAAALPVWRGCRVPVAVALADFGARERAFGQSLFDRALARVSGGARPLLLAVRNSFRRRTRLVLTVGTLAVSGVFFLSALNVRASLIHTLDQLFATRRFDLALSLGEMVPTEKVERAIAAAPGALRSEGWIHREAVLGDDQRFSVLGLPPGTPMLALSIFEGRDLVPGDIDALVANTALAARFPEIRVGSSVVLRLGSAESRWRVVGISREPFSPAIAYLPRATFDSAGETAGLTNSVRVALADSTASSIASFKEALDRELEAEGIRVLAATSQADSRYGFDQHMVMIYVFLVVVSVLIAVVGGLGLSTTMSLNVLERHRELGVLKAIGATSGMIQRIVVTEALVIGLSSFALAALAAGPISRFVGGFIARGMFRGELGFTFDPWGLPIWLAVSLTLAALASILPARRAAKSPVAVALGFE